MTPREALSQAIAHSGGAAKLARTLGISTQAVVQWARVPSRRVVAVEAATEARITRHQLRPDLYPEEPGAQASQFHSGARA